MAGSDAQAAPLPAVAPFAAALATVPLIWIGAIWGGWTVLLVPAYAFATFTLLDLRAGLDLENADPRTPLSALFWHRALTWIWMPLQATSLLGVIWYVTHASDSGLLERIVLFYGMGAMTGAIGIVYAHELLHQPARAERWLADILLAMVLYSHFRSEHLLVHHVHVGTPRDAVTARYNEPFPRFLARVYRTCPRSAWQAEGRRLARAHRPAWHHSNPFWRYAALQVAMLCAVLAAGGLQGLALWLWQALVATTLLELTNYVEHYGLTRKYLGQGRYEPVRPHHSWNAAHGPTNRLLINLQRHSDHHHRPDRRYPLLQSHGPDIAPQLPRGYPAMAFLAAIPPLWRRRMNPRVRAWRAMHYPEITDWQPYRTGRHAD